VASRCRKLLKAHDFQTTFGKIKSAEADLEHLLPQLQLQSEREGSANPALLLDPGAAKVRRRISCGPRCGGVKLLPERDRESFLSHSALAKHGLIECVLRQQAERTNIFTPVSRRLKFVPAANGKFYVT
jgi:hypothetical protein